MPDSTAKYGLLAEFETAADIMHAAEKVRDAGYRRWDVYTPFPVHGAFGNEDTEKRISDPSYI